MICNGVGFGSKTMTRIGLDLGPRLVGSGLRVGFGSGTKTGVGSSLRVGFGSGSLPRLGLVQV